MKITQNRIIVAAILTVIALWLIDSSIDFRIFDKGQSFVEEMFMPGAYEVYIRSLASVIVIASGLFMAIAWGKAERSEAKTKEINIDLKVAQRLTQIGNWKWIIATNEVTWSEGLCRILKLNVDDPVPPFAEMERFYTPESWKQLNKLVTRAFDTGEPYEVELEEIRADGVIISTITRGEVDFDSDGQLINLHGTVQDITERKNIEELLKRSELQYRTLVETADDVILLTDLQGKQLFRNNAFWTSRGYAVGENIPLDGFSGVHPDDAPLIQSKMSELLKNGTLTSEYRIKHKDGHWLDQYAKSRVINDKFGQPVSILAVIRDITETKKADQTLQFQASLLDAELDSVYLLDSSGNILYANKVACSCYGYSKEELLNMNLSQLDDMESAGLIAPRVKGILEKGHGTFNVNHRRKDGSLIPMEIHTSLVKSDNVQFLLSVARDTTERRKLQEQLMAQDRLASIGQLVAGVAHELGNPLGSLVLYSELLLQTELPEDAIKDLKTINAEAMRTTDIVKNLLTFARKQPQEKILFNVNETIQRVIVLRNHEEKVNNILVNLNLALDLAEVLGNIAQLQQVFLNLVINAEQSMLEAHKKGVLTITTEQSGNAVKISFADDGPGISRENMKQLFTPFFTTKGVGKGTGLGLSICHGIVTEHGGNIYAESELGKGAIFIVELPISLG